MQCNFDATWQNFPTTPFRSHPSRSNNSIQFNVPAGGHCAFIVCFIRSSEVLQLHGTPYCLLVSATVFIVLNQSHSQGWQ